MSKAQVKNRLNTDAISTYILYVLISHPYYMFSPS
jgi:hypothetical protein